MFGLQISGVGLGRTRKILEIKISSLQVFSHQQLLHARFFSNVSSEYIQLCMPKPGKPQLFAQKQALGGSLFYLWFSLLYMFYRVSVQAGNPVLKQTNKLSVKSNRCFLSGSQLYEVATSHFISRKLPYMALTGQL